MAKKLPSPGDLPPDPKKKPGPPAFPKPKLPIEDEIVEEIELIDEEIAEIEEEPSFDPAREPVSEDSINWADLEGSLDESPAGASSVRLDSPTDAATVQPIGDPKASEDIFDDLDEVVDVTDESPSAIQELEAEEVNEDMLDVLDDDALEPVKPAPPSVSGSKGAAPTLIAGDVERAPLAGKATGKNLQSPSRPKKTTALPKIPSKFGTPTMIARGTQPAPMPEESSLDDDVVDAMEVIDEDASADSEADVAAMLLEDDAAVGDHAKPSSKGQGEDGLDEIVLVESGSTVDLGESDHKLGERSSGVDMIAEALESGVDILPPEANRGKRIVAAPKVAAPSKQADEDDSSAVDLGSSPPVNDIEVESPLSSSKYAAGGVKELHESDAVILDGGVHEPDSKPARKEKKPAKAEATPVPGAVKKASLFKNARPWLGGMAAASFLFIFFAALVWYMFPGVLASIPESPNQAGFRWQKQGTPAPSSVNVASRVATAGLAEGKFDEVIQELGNASEKEEINTRALAVWLKYQKDQVAKNLPLQEKDESVAELLKDFESTGNQELSDQVKATIRQDQDSRAKATQLTQAQAAIAKATGVDPKNLDLPKFIAQIAEAGGKLGAISQTLASLKLSKEVQDLDPKAVDALLKDWSEAKKAADDAGKLLGAKQDVLVKNLQELIDAKLGLDSKFAEVNKQLEAAKIDGKDAKGIEALAAIRDGLAKEKSELLKSVDATLAEFKAGGMLTDDADKLRQLVASAKKARQTSESPLAGSLGQLMSPLGDLGGALTKLLQRGFDLTDQKTQLAAGKLKEILGDSPEQRLDTWLIILQDRTHNNSQELSKLMKFHAWILSNEANAKPEVKAKANLALGLALRNAMRFAEARPALEQAQAAAKTLNPKAPWARLAQQAMSELTDPDVYYLPAVTGLHNQGQYKAALEELRFALTAFPNDPRLMLLRAMVRLDMAGAKLDPTTAKYVVGDAEAASTHEQAAAEAFYVLGRLAETQSEWSKAEENYRQALKAHRGSSEAASRYRVALARLLLRDRVTAPSPETDKKDTGGEEVRAIDPALLVLLLTLAQNPGDGDDRLAAKRLEEGIELAKGLLESKDAKVRAEGHLLLGQAYLKQGKRTEALMESLKGMELLHPDDKTRELSQLLRTHAALQQPEVQGRSNPLQAERHFALGLEHFWGKQYPAAEEEFKKAVSHFDQDARYQYFLGLARYLQKSADKKATAVFAFEQGAKLEAMSRPHSPLVNASLERIQGELRTVVNGYRTRATAER